MKDPEEVYNKYLEFVTNHNAVLNVNKMNVTDKQTEKRHMRENSHDQESKLIYINQNMQNEAD